jgi:hypothetical protein
MARASDIIVGSKLMSGEGRLPNFLLVGAMRSGTTSLFDFLRSHPQVVVALTKETHFFDVNFDRGLHWYTSQFIPREGAHAFGEASQTYMYDGAAAHRMAEAVPDAKLVAILRDPADRAYSHYWLKRSHGRETLGFREALAAEQDRIDGGSLRDRFAYSYVDRGRYVYQLRRLASLFPRTRIHVLLLDDLRGDASETLARLNRFLGIEDVPISPGSDRPVNAFQEFRSLRMRRFTNRLKRRPGSAASFAVSVLGRLNRRRSHYPPMHPDDREHLGELFRQDNERLAQWLGRDLGAWTGMRPSGSPRAGTTESPDLARRRHVGTPTEPRV